MINMGYAVYKVGERFGGYGVPTICEHPECEKEIDRGMSYACGGEPFSEVGCDRYFCSKHLLSELETDDGDFVQVCIRCLDGKPEFPYKKEHKDWVAHLLKDDSRAERRKNNKDKVKTFTSKLTNENN